MKSFALALLVATAIANYVKKGDAGPGAAHAAISKIGGSYEFSYEQTKLKMKVYTKTELGAALAADTDVISVGTFIPYSPASGAPSKWYALVCKMTFSNTNTKFTPAFKIYDHTTAMISHATTDLDAVGQLGTTTKLSVAGAATAPSTKVIAQPNAPTADAGYALTWGLTDTWVDFDAAKKVFTCQMSFEKTEADTATAKQIYDTMNAQIGATKISYYTNTGGSTVVSSHQSLAFSIEQLGATETVPSIGNFVYSSKGKTVKDSIASSKHQLSLWTSTLTVGMAFDHEMTLENAVAANKKFEQFSCVKFSTTNYVCALSLIETDSAMASKWSWYVFKKTSAAPADADFTDAKIAFTSSTGFGNNANYSQLLKWVGSQANPSLIGTTDASAQSSSSWYWDATANKHHTDKKIFQSSIQYKADEALDATATTVLDSLKLGAATAFCGIWTDSDPTAGSGIGSCAMAAPAASSVGALSTVASIGLAMTALAMSF